MPLSAFIADSTFPHIPRRSCGGDTEAMAFAAPHLHGAVPQACMTAREPFDLAFSLASQRRAAHVHSTMQVAARRG
jgi:hypothetical protein